MSKSTIHIESVIENSTMQVRRWKELAAWLHTLRDVWDEIGVDDVFNKVKAEVAPRGADLKGPSLKLKIAPGAGQAIQAEVRAVAKDGLVSKTYTFPVIQIQGWDGMVAKQFREMLRNKLAEWYMVVLTTDWAKAPAAATAPAGKEKAV